MSRGPRGLGGYGWTFSSTGATRVAAAWGTAVTPGNNAKGSYAQVIAGASVTRDVFGVMVSFNSNAVSTAARDTIVDIGVDPAGGTAYTVAIPDLLASCAAPAVGATGSGLHYQFPLWIRAGSSIAARASINNATVGTLRCRIQLFGQPVDIDACLYGTRCFAVGVTAASSAGTAVTPGTTGEGTWTSLGTIPAGVDPFWVQYGVGVNNATITATAYAGDLGIGNASSKIVAGEDRVWQGTTGEAWYDNGPVVGHCAAQGGQTVYGRLQCSGTALTGLSMAAYFIA